MSDQKPTQQRFVVPVCGRCHLPLVSHICKGFGCICKGVSNEGDEWVEVRTFPAPSLIRDDGLRSLVEDVRHALATMHGLVAADQVAPEKTWTLDFSDLLGRIDALLVVPDFGTEED